MDLLCVWVAASPGLTAGGSEIHLETNLLAGEDRADYEPYSRRRTSAAESAL